MIFDVCTLFPEIFSALANHSIIKRALQKDAIALRTFNIRDFATDKYKTVDDKPYGGGPGMVLKCEPVFDCIEHALDNGKQARLILLSPQGQTLNQKLVKELAKEERLLIMCGHYEGFDERIRTGFDWLELSIGEYVLSGGELAACVLIDAITRLLPGVLGDETSKEFESFEIEGLLDFPQYTRPENFRGAKVPKILLSGNHEEVAKWRLEQAIKKTKKRKPNAVFDENKILEKISELAYLQRNRKKVNFHTLQNSKKKLDNKREGESDEPADSQD